MAENCDNKCNECSQDCEHNPNRNVDFKAKLNPKSSVKKVIGIMSGKGGVGKSLVTSLLAVATSRRGYHTAVMDADITGPSIPKIFGVNSKASGDEEGIYPVKSHSGIELMSINLVLDNETDPVIWRGPILASVVKQFWSEIIWDKIDFMFIDMPPGTGDVPLTVFQSIPLDGIIIVTSPQELVSMIVEKAVKMAKTMKIPIIGLVENMSYFVCPDTLKRYNVFGESHIDEIASKENLEVLAKLPIDSELTTACDKGLIETYGGLILDKVVEKLERL